MFLSSLHKKNKGFTLIELLMVVSIIALLSAIILTNLNATKNKAREASRKTALKQLQIALELYRTQYGYYPSSGTYPKFLASAPTWPGTFSNGDNAQYNADY